ncbi:MAG: hypothetical protein LBD52_04525 [Prevotellaceae bacterium]|nr:hypothetical protein [Prevotellaceae bacterium]
MKRSVVILLCSACSLVPKGQGTPRWADAQSREAEYPSHTYITGFAEDNLLPSETLAQATEQLRKAALGRLSENIQVMVSKKTHSGTISVIHSNNFSETEVFGAEITTAADAEMAGVNTETYFDKAKKTLYAFAYANRRELMRYYNATATADIQQIKSTVKAAAQWEAQREKAKARKQYGNAKKQLAKTEKTLFLLRALDTGLSGSDGLFPAWQELNDEVAQALAQVELLVYVNDREDIFGESCAIVANRLQAELTGNDYRITDNHSRADFTLNLHATTRKTGDAGSAIVFCYADVVVELVDNHARESLYKEAFSHKGGSTTFERAGREALEEAAEAIAEKLNKIIE